MRPWIILLVLAALVTFMPGIVSSHGVSVTAHWEGKEVHTDSYFADGKPLVNARASVYDMADNVILEGKTDETGTWDFPNPEVGDLKIVVMTGSGHRSETVLRQGSAGGSFADEKIELDALRKEVLELKRMVQKPGLVEILGGLGWIIGITGAYMWGVSRRRSEGERS